MRLQIKMDKSLIFCAIVLLFTLSIETSPSMAKKLNASQAFDDTWNTATDLENELEQKRAAAAAAAAAKSSSGSMPLTSSYSSPTSSGLLPFSSSSSSSSMSPTSFLSSAAAAATNQWSSWSEWSTCSRTCDGGIMQQIRRCYNLNGNCKGESIRYRICNMQPCPEQREFRSEQCAAFNDVPYDGTLYKWIPHYDYIEPCALTCRGRPAHLPDEMLSHEQEASEDSEHYEEPSVIVQLSGHVQDGTRCRSGSLDMCIQGKCQRVGCDLKIGSTKKIDACGVCGGDGNSCTQPLYHWETAPMSQCSVTCGGGYKMSHPVCKNRLTTADVDDSLCNAATRPEPAVLLCNTHTCPPRWIADEWSPCSRLCGQGYRERMVVCAEENNGIKTRVSDIMCRIPKPSAQETCMIEDCPKWEIEEWTGCSVSCGQGIQMRGVECKSGDGSLSAKCDPHTKPSSAQQCSTGISCDGSGIMSGTSNAATNNLMNSGGQIIIGSSAAMMNRDGSSDFEDDEDDEHTEEQDENDEGGEEPDDMDDDKYSAEGDPDSLSYNDQAPIYAHHMSNLIHHEEPLEPRTQYLSTNYRTTDQPSIEPTFIKESEWSPCSVTCGEGIRRRPYKCKIFLEYSRTIATVNDTLCEGPKPHDEVERCVEELCMLPSHTYDDQYPRDSIKVGVSEPGKTYVWREQGYTSCSASCLGGVEELIINCVREDNGRVVSPFLCAPETKPEARVRTCNDRPCPPRWNYSDYTPCSKSCGIGIKTREVQCIHEVTRGGENTMVVPNSMCPQPPPADRQYCNVLDCPVRWEVGEWSKCSHTCGYGIKERKVECKQIMAQEHKIERPESMCPSSKPPDKKPCNVKPCPPEDPKPIIQISNTTHIQHDPKKSKITLKIGGAGVVFFGTQVKIKCPVKRYNRTKIKWSKDHKPLTKSRKFKVSKKGALRILDITFRDAGVYSCHAGLSSAEIQIEVKAKPGQQAEDLEKQELDRLVRERSGSEALASADMTAADGMNSTMNTRRRQPNGRERNRRPKTNGIQQHVDGSIVEDEQAHNGLPQPASANSGGSRTQALLAIPYFQALLSNLQYLWPFQKFNSHTRGHHRHQHQNYYNHENHQHNNLLHDKGLQFGIDIDQYEQPRDEPAKPLQTMKDLTIVNTAPIATNVHADDIGNVNVDGMAHAETATADAAAVVAVNNENDDRKAVDDTSTTTTLEYQNQENVEIVRGGVEKDDVDDDGDEREDIIVEGKLKTAFEEGPHVRWQERHWSHANNNNDFGYITNYPLDDGVSGGVDETTTLNREDINEIAISTYKWLTSEWSACTQKCGDLGVGLRRRTVSCVRVRNTFFRNRANNHNDGDNNNNNINGEIVAEKDTSLDISTTDKVATTTIIRNVANEIVDNSYCEDYGLHLPSAYETCGYDEEDDTHNPCPRWIDGPWTICQQSRCYQRNTAIQKREVQCQYGNGTLAVNGCDENVKPISRQECYNERCKGVWRVESWSKCNAPCGRSGIKYRILQCVWYGTRRPAGNACRNQPRPVVMKVCKSPPCRTKSGHCKDTSRYCRNVRTMGLCRFHRYKEKCCKSCKFNLYN